MVFFGGGKCPNLGVVNVRILGVVNVCLANNLTPFRPTLWQNEGSEEVLIYVMVNDFWHTLALIENAQIFAWEHICFEIDTVEETIGVARNGKLLGLDIKVPGLGDNKPAHLQENLVLGIFDDEEVTSQFSGQVTNLNMYNKKQGESKLVDLTSKPCKSEGDLLSWGSTTWTDHGADGSWEEVDETVVPSTSLLLVLLVDLYICSPFSS